MQNSDNKTYYYIPETEPKNFRQKVAFDPNIMQEMISAIASCNTLEEVEAKVDEIFLENAFLEAI